MPSIFISVYPFGLSDPAPRRLLEESGHRIIYSPHPRKLKPEETAEYAKDCDAVIAGTEDLTPLIRSSAKLRFISRVGIGLDSVPLNLCRQKQIAVDYTPDAVTPAVAELTLGLMLSLLRYIPETDHDLKHGSWNRKTGRRLAKCAVGIIGFGRVGVAVARLLQSFSPPVILVHDIADKELQVAHFRQSGLNIRQADFNEVVQNSDIISLHVPLTASTQSMFNADALVRMKPGALLINTCRGAVVNEDDLYNALHSGKLHAAATDVYSEEPYTGKLLTLKNLITTPHIGSCTHDCRINMEREAAESVIYFFKTGQGLRPVPAHEYSASKD